MLRGTLIWPCLLAAAACYRPAATGDCTVRCTTEEDCPAGLQCTAGLCHGPAVAGCSVVPPVDGDLEEDASDASDGLDGSVPVDATIAPDGAVCYGSGGTAVGPFVRICPPGVIPTNRTFNVGSSVNTQTSCDLVVTQTTGPELCVLMGNSITVHGLTTVGARPLVLLATDMLTVDGPIDVASHAGASASASAPAGSPYAGCITAGTNGISDAGNMGGGGGGAGASFRGGGGTGGSGNGGTTLGGTPAATVGATPSFVRGGCMGGTGGMAVGSLAGGRPGGAGGAIYFLAGGAFRATSTARINASGGGGGASGVRTGGGGGGSGGMIIVDAPQLQIDATAQLFALGGGGAAGGGSTGVGVPGSDPLSPSSIAPGAPPMVGGGGSGGQGSNPIVGSNGAGGGSPGGGGGGGGGAGGYVVFSAPVILPAGTVAPPP